MMSLEFLSHCDTVSDLAMYAGVSKNALLGSKCKEMNAF